MKFLFMVTVSFLIFNCSNTGGVKRWKKSDMKIESLGKKYGQLNFSINYEEYNENGESKVLVEYGTSFSHFTKLFVQVEDLWGNVLATCEDKEGLRKNGELIYRRKIECSLPDPGDYLYLKIKNFNEDKEWHYSMKRN